MSALLELPTQVNKYFFFLYQNYIKWHEYRSGRRNGQLINELSPSNLQIFLFNISNSTMYRARIFVCFMLFCCMNILLAVLSLLFLAHRAARAAGRASRPGRTESGRGFQHMYLDSPLPAPHCRAGVGGLGGSWWAAGHKAHGTEEP